MTCNKNTMVYDNTYIAVNNQSFCYGKKRITKQERISVECQSSACRPMYGLHTDRIWTGPGIQSWDQGIRVRVGVYGRGCGDGGPQLTVVTWGPCWQTEWQTDTTENITFPQLCWRAVNMVGGVYRKVRRDKSGNSALLFTSTLELRQMGTRVEYQSSTNVM